MARFGTGKHTPGKYVFLLSCVILLALVLLADFLWASSSSSRSSPYRVLRPPSSSSSSFHYWSPYLDLSMALSAPNAKQVSSMPISSRWFLEDLVLMQCDLFSSVVERSAFSILLLRYYVELSTYKANLVMISSCRIPFGKLDSRIWFLEDFIWMQRSLFSRWIWILPAVFLLCWKFIVCSGNIRKAFRPCVVRSSILPFQVFYQEF
ncbi:hypothetical protein BHM03_00039298 [Ensete ventricosum]|nr:hypothetical protein BHM03_00039298 [Ensete ventricosum]